MGKNLVLDMLLSISEDKRSLNVVLNGYNVGENLLLDRLFACNRLEVKSKLAAEGEERQK